MCTSYIFACLLSLSLAAGARLEPYFPRPFMELPLFPDGRIAGGKDTNVEEVPYQVALEYYNMQFCGGALISRRHVLTAAHCVNGPTAPKTDVRIGSTLRQKDGIVIPCKSYKVHPKFNEDNFDNDVAVIELETDVEFCDSAKPIQVVDSEPRPGMKMNISGWGHLHEEYRGSSPILQSVEIPVIDRARCAEMYKDVRFNITDRMICAYESGKDACQGDRGGAAVVGGKIAGIVSWGLGCARPDYPGVYTNVADASIRAFIREHANV